MLLVKYFYSICFCWWKWKIIKIKSQHVQFWSHCYWVHRTNFFFLLPPQSVDVLSRFIYTALCRIHIRKASTLFPIALSNHYQWFLVVIANVIKKRQMGVSSQIYLSEKLSFSNEWIGFVEFLMQISHVHFVADGCLYPEMLKTRE